MTTKQCHQCQVIQPLSAFPKDKTVKGGYRNQCKACRAAAKRKSNERRRDERARTQAAFVAAGQPKTCTKCSKTKPQDQFNRNKQTPDGLHAYCRDCQGEIGRAWREENAEHRQAYQKAYESSGRGRERQREHYWRHREKRLAAAAKWNQENGARRWQRKKERPQEKLADYLRSRLSRAVRAQMREQPERTRGASAVRDLGCTLPELMRHLEAQFKPGMTWENYGEWHIDHVEALSKFDLRDREQCRKACHYSNLQPLWATENLKKGDR